MREIKFRAWDKDRKIWFWPSSLEFFTDDKRSVAFIYDEDGYKIFNFELVQFTNLKDKNGKEIYEGDILTSENKRGGIIEWDDLELKFWAGEHEPYRMKDREIIGNIYENPELLK